MESIAPPGAATQAARVPTKRDVAPEPPTGRALWPTFMRRTLDDEKVRACAEDKRKPS
ncbi:hypothetical protein GXW78_13095 [Roseomonas terrae]|jgi:hypothetical protein|uniref:Uncharacterized protein n=1 Tax=Neoroseomonas terrae TaxID=424799 RepID=A0ABS5EHV8_9PROT|nr:hypothetical protein [Neoroseomonas terrae]MBR0650605.1 hypothetical protein [Neoroseomonas terrae]